MNNISAQVDWVGRELKRFQDIGRLIPEGQDKLYRAIERGFCAGRTVVDVGSSCGVGTNILSYSSRFAWGLDVNEDAVEFAKQMHKRPNVDFEVYDIENPPSREVSKFELVVMSEVLEHLADPEIGLTNLKRFFSPASNTIGFITAPNISNEEVKVRDAANPLHLSHWTAGQFYELMTKHFGVVTLYSVDKLYDWSQEETIDGNSTDGLIVAKVEVPK